MASLSAYFQRQQFRPGFLGVFINPFYFMRRGLYLAVRDLAPRLSGRLLDVGCGQKPYQDLFTSVSEYVGLEFDSPDMRRRSKADTFYDGHHFPFPDASFDSLMATEVLEHIFNLAEFLAEVHRVLKPGGMAYFTAPFAWDEHEQPRDYARYSSFGIAHLLRTHGFEIVEQRKTNADARTLFQLRNCYIHKIIPFKNYRARLLTYLIFIAPFTLLGLILYPILPKNSDLYLSNIVLAQKSRTS